MRRFRRRRRFRRLSVRTEVSQAVIDALIGLGYVEAAQRDNPAAIGEFITFDAAGKVFEAVKSGAWDIAFVAIEPVRSAEIEFTSPYVIIDGTYMVPVDSPLKTIADVDRPGVRIAVGLGSAEGHHRSRDIGSGPRDDRSVRQRQARGRGRRAATACRIRRNPFEPAGDGRPVHGNSAGHGHAQGPHGWGALSGRIC
jgi:Bacterial extracellular solute-binding proteins, family 3